MRRVVLCRPEGPRNVGMILRVAQNFGPCELFVVAPARASLLVHPEFEQMSHGAEDGRAAIRVVDTLEEALVGTHWTVGFTARVRGRRVRDDWRELAPRLVERADSARERLALVFGNEVTGMTGPECDLCHDLAHVRTSGEHTSLNLAMCVGVVLSSLFTGEGAREWEPGGNLLAGEGRAFLKQRMKEVFAGRVALTPAAARAIEESIERVFSRAPLEDRDARAWHLMLRALGSSLAPTELGLRPNRKGGRREDVLKRLEQRQAFESKNVQQESWTSAAPGPRRGHTPEEDPSGQSLPSDGDED